jgi:hypothetical protein
MPKYLIEGNINFYDELYKSLDNYNEHSQTKEDVGNNNLCLITQKQLTNNYVELECKHKFNYNAIFHDVLNHKKDSKRLMQKQLLMQFISEKDKKIVKRKK